MKLTSFNGNSIEGTPSVTLGIDQSLKSTGVCLQINGTNYIMVIQDEYKPINDMFVGKVFKPANKGGEPKMKKGKVVKKGGKPVMINCIHHTFYQKERIQHQVFEMDSFINTVLYTNGLTKDDIQEVRIESLAMSQKGRSIIDLALCISTYLDYIKRELKNARCRLVSAFTLKKDYTGQGRPKKGAPKEHPKQRIFDRFNKDHNTHLEIRSTKNPDEDGADCHVLANHIN